MMMMMMLFMMMMVVPIIISSPKVSRFRMFCCRPSYIRERYLQQIAWETHVNEQGSWDRVGPKVIG